MNCQQYTGFWNQLLNEPLLCWSLIDAGKFIGILLIGTIIMAIFMAGIEKLSNK